MCCTNDPKLLAEIRNRKGWIRGWKVVWTDGQTENLFYCRPPLKVGLNAAHRLTPRYRRDRPHGFHIYLKKPSDRDHKRVLCVLFKAADCIAAGKQTTSSTHIYGPAEYTVGDIDIAVALRIKVTKAAWRRGKLLA